MKRQPSLTCFFGGGLPIRYQTTRNIETNTPLAQPPRAFMRPWSNSVNGNAPLILLPFKFSCSCLHVDTYMSLGNRMRGSSDQRVKLRAVAPYLSASRPVSVYLENGSARPMMALVTSKP
jgi:hypothetical protein